MDKNLNFLIVGLGLIGGSVAKGLRKNNYNVYALDLNDESIDYAYKNNIILNNESDINLIKKADVIILCLYPSQIINWVKKHKPLFKDNVIISDVTGIKGSIVKPIQDLLDKDQEFIPMHPMAGKEVSGVKHSSEAIFKGANLIIVPTENNTQRGIQLLEDFGKELEFKRIEILSVEEHDKMISFLSQLPHVLAVSLMCNRNNDHLIRYTGDSFRDLTRIAKINGPLWSELFISNKENIVSDIDSFINTLEELKEAIKKENTEELIKMFETSKERRIRFDK